MSEAMAPVPKNHPMFVAWEAYKATEEYVNSRKWAAFAAHVDGSLWAAFCEGWNAACRQLESESRKQ